jgi:hypothetical protein
MDGFPSDGFMTTTILARLMPSGRRPTPSACAQLRHSQRNPQCPVYVDLRRSFVGGERLLWVEAVRKGDIQVPMRERPEARLGLLAV